MYLGVDVGGSKTLLAVFDAKGNILSKQKFQTPVKYTDFLQELSTNIDQVVESYKIKTVCCALPALLDRENGIAISFGNLGWTNVAIKKDLKEILPKANILIENDANLAGLSEAINVINKYKKVLYLTLSTGIGDGIIVNGIIDPTFADSEPGQMILENNGKLQKWEDFASGRAIHEQTGKLASEINDEYFWHKYVKGLAKGIDVLVATLSPEVVIIGGGVGSHFNKFGHFLIHELKKYENNMIAMPPIIQAKHSEEAVIYGCYQLIKQNR